MLPSTPLRPRAVAIAGEGAYTAIFSILSLIAIYWLWTQFNAAPYGDKLWLMPGWWRWVQAALVLFSFILMFGGLLTPNPSMPVGAQALKNPDVADGIFAITRAGCNKTASAAPSLAGRTLRPRPRSGLSSPSCKAAPSQPQRLRLVAHRHCGGRMGRHSALSFQALRRAPAPIRDIAAPRGVSGGSGGRR
jgi:NnrU protein